MFIFETFLPWYDFLCQAGEGKLLLAQFRKFMIELEVTSLSLGKRIQAFRIYYGTKNAVQTVRQLKIPKLSYTKIEVASQFRRHFQSHNKF